MHSAGYVSRKRFQTTRWSLILRLQGQVADEKNVWNDLAKLYWFPLYAFCRGRGYSEADALDLTQGFFVHLLHPDRFSSVAPEKGRFRNFLLVSFKNFLSNQLRLQSAQTRSSGKPVVSICSLNADSLYLRSDLSEESPEVAFERAWAVSLLNHVNERLAAEYELAGKTKLYSVIHSHLVPGNETTSRQDASSELDLSKAAVNMSIMRMRRRYREILLEEVAATVDNDDDVEDELRSLMIAFQNVPSRPNLPR